MKTNTTILKNGFWIMIEEPAEINETAATQSNQSKNDSESFRDTYDFYPDSGF